MIAQDATQMIGRTPIVEITHLSDTSGVTLLAKAEYLNPTGSIKDRIAVHMVDRAIARGEITDQTTLIEPTSGNTGIGLAAVCAAQGIGLILTMPESMSRERRKLLEHLGATIVLTPAAEGMGGSIREAKRLAEEFEHGLILGQFTHPDNPAAHDATTAPEILEATGGDIDIFVAAVGTGGSFTGITRTLKRSIPHMKAVAVEPATSPVLSGGQPGAHSIQGIGAGFVPEILETDLIDEILTVTDDEAITCARNAARKAGLLVGISSGANLAALHRIARRPESRGQTLLTLLPDGAERYMSTDLFGRVWEQGL